MPLPHPGDQQSWQSQKETATAGQSCRPRSDQHGLRPARSAGIAMMGGPVWRLICRHHRTALGAIPSPRPFGW